MSSPALRCAPPLLRGLRSKLPSAAPRLLTPPSLLLQLPRVRFFFVCSAAPSSSRGSARRRGERAFGAAAEAAEEDSNCGSRNGGEKGGSYFFAEEDVSWKSLGISEGVARALSNASINRPSLVQAACIPQILTGKDVIIAAETGSGKTHGYLVPLFERLSAKSDACKTGGSEEVSERHKISLILCPNVMLCEQVTQMANGLVDDSGQPLLKAVAVCGRRGWPVTQPDILVSTPAALLNYLFDFDPEKKRRPQFLRDVKCVVFDEADMLLCGSFQNQIIRLINMLRFEEKILSKMESSTQQNITDKVDMEDHYSEMLVNEDHEEEESNDLDDLEDTETEEAEVAASRFKDWRRVRKVYKRSKQYIFVAATLPQSGKKTAGGMLKRMFPDSIWISGDFLHRHNPRLEQRWIEVTPDTQVDALIDAVKYGFRCNPQDCDNDDASRVMVFTNTVEAAQSVAQILERVGLQCILYHRASSLEERTNNLNSFRDKGGILVCTDAAARGLDVPKISHVIQAEFATSVVDFLHRVGRTARAGETGVVTSLYTKSNRDLVAAVRQAETMDQPVEKAFSRKRSFRNKLKKIGRSEMAQPKGIKITAELSGQQIS